MVASRSMAGLAGYPRLHKGFLLRVNTGGVTSGALGPPVALLRLIR